jgi:hypothetical protein
MYMANWETPLTLMPGLLAAPPQRALSPVLLHTLSPVFILVRIPGQRNTLDTTKRICTRKCVPVSKKIRKFEIKSSATLID